MKFILLGALAGFGFGNWIVAEHKATKLQAEAVKRHYAEWRVNQDTQEVTFVWVEEKAK